MRHSNEMSKKQMVDYITRINGWDTEWNREALMKKKRSMMRQPKDDIVATYESVGQRHESTPKFKRAELAWDLKWAEKGLVRSKENIASWFQSIETTLNRAVEESQRYKERALEGSMGMNDAIAWTVSHLANISSNIPFGHACSIPLDHHQVITDLKEKREALAAFDKRHKAKIKMYCEVNVETNSNETLDDIVEHFVHLGYEEAYVKEVIDSLLPIEG